MKFHRITLLRRILIPLFKYCNPGDIRVTHPYTRKKLWLHSFRHKGYWFHGAKRERETIAFFAKIVAESQTVVELGGHIGFLTQYFSQLVGPLGMVYVFEPGPNNLRYLNRNVAGLENVKVFENAVSNVSGTVSFFLDNLTGQNNSLIPDYSVFAVNKEDAFTDVGTETVQVDAITLDEFAGQRKLNIDFIKIDIEGAELYALQGMKQTLTRFRPALMVEVTQNAEQVFSLLTELGYRLFRENGSELLSGVELNFNTFCLHPTHHAQILEEFDSISRTEIGSHE